MNPMEQRQFDQMVVNFNWLLTAMDEAHASLCPTQNGTWQQRANQVVDAARKLRQEPPRKLLDRPAQKIKRQEGER